MTIKLALIAALGGAIGSAARYGLGVYALRAFGGGFPWGTFGVNIGGCFLMGLFAGFVLTRPDLSPELRVFIATGVLGGFTTFSAFALDAYHLYERDVALAGAYALGSVILSLAALLLGLAAYKAMS